MHWWDGHMGWMGIWWILGVALIAVLVWAIVRSAGGPMAGPRESPEDIVRRRYAKGEIDRDAFERMLTDLKG